MLSSHEPLLLLSLRCEIYTNPWLLVEGSFDFLYLSFKTVRTNLVIGYFAHIVQSTAWAGLIGTLRSYEGCIKIELCARLSVMRLFLVDQIVQTRRSELSPAWDERFPYKGRELKIFCCGLELASEPQIWKFHVVVWQTTSKCCSKKRAARAARLFFLIQPIKSLICGVVVVVAFSVVVIS